MNEFLNRKKVNISFKTYFIDAMGAMAYGLFASLLVGTILNTIGQEFNIEFLSKTLWPIVQAATGPAIAVSIAYSLNAPDLVLFSSAVVGVAGYQLGGPIGVFISTIFAVEFGKLISKETKIDIVLTPVVTVLVGAIIATFIGPYIQAMMVAIGNAIMAATKQQPLIMGIIVSVAMGMILTLPISSAAICIMLGLSGLAGGAATVGCCANMIGFAVISYKDNGFEGLLAQGIGTSMLQMPNIIRKPVIWLPSIVASAILG
ncbi:PTS sugar transporter subunit IIC, partial [Peptoniphilus duerdenii]|uniref:PTS transporter subunit IIC n=1 Tax=Peptoniphilus duerdenii TaxID=507750 RepID=UPI0023F2FCDE